MAMVFYSRISGFQMAIRRSYFRVELLNDMTREKKGITTCISCKRISGLKPKGGAIFIKASYEVLGCDSFFFLAGLEKNKRFRRTFP